MTAERNPYEKLALDDPRRPIRVIETTKATVPEPSERFLMHYVDRVAFPNGNEGYHHRVKLPEGVMLAHLDDEEKLALVENYRHPLGRNSVELPSGALEPDELERLASGNPFEQEEVLNEAARREFEEEVGWRLGADAVQRLLKGPLQGSVGYADQTYHTFFGEGGEPTQQTLDDGEQGLLKYRRYALDDAIEMVGHEIVDPATSAGVMALGLAYGKSNLYLQRLRKDKIVL